MSWAECGGVWEEGLKSKEGGALACAKDGCWGTEELGSYPAGNGEPVKAVELGSSLLLPSALSFGGPCPLEKALTLRVSPVQAQISKWPKSQPRVQVVFYVP